MARRAVYISLLAVIVAASAAFALGSAHAGGTAGPKPLKGVQFGTVGMAGQLFSSSKNVVGAARLGTGEYELTLTGSVAKCAFSATQGNNPVADAPNTSGETTVGFGTAATAVKIKTFDSAGAAADRAVHVIVAC